MLPIRLLLCIFLWVGLQARLQADPGIVATNQVSGAKADARLGQVLSGCGSLSAKFFLDLDGGEARNYRWDLALTSSTQSSPVHNYPRGSYTVSLQVEYRGAGEADFQSRDFRIQLQVDAAPSISFEADRREVCLDGKVVFRNTTQGVSLSEATLVVDGRVYDFSSGTTEVVFKRPGVFSVTMKGVSGQGCASIESKEDYITVGGPYTLRILASDTISCQPEAELSFTAQALDMAGNPFPLEDRDLRWDFGDGTSVQTGRQVFHKFSRKKGSVFQVRLSGKYLECEQQAAPVYVRLLSLPADPVTAVLPQRVCEAYQVQFSTSFGPEFDGLPLLVDYGDGSPAQLVRLPATFSHDYLNNTPNTLPIQAKFSLLGSTGGCQTIYDLQVPAVATGRISLKNNISCGDTYQVEAELRDASNLASNYYWLVGDNLPRYVGQTAISHTLQGSGKRWLKLVFDPQVAGLSPCTLDSVQVESVAPEVRIYGGRGGCAPFSTGLTHGNFWNGKPITQVGLKESSSLWVLSDSLGNELRRSSGDPFRFSGLACGTYRVVLRVEGGPASDPTTCSWGDTITLRVGEPPILDFEAEPAPLICNGTQVRFTNRSTPTCVTGKVRYQWDYDYRGGEGSFQDAEDSLGNGAFLYDNYAPDTKVTVALRAIANGCTTKVVKSYQDLLQVLSPRADFSMQVSPCDQGVLKVKNNSQLAAGREAVFDWLFTIDGQAYQVSTTQLQEDPVQKLPPLRRGEKGVIPAGSKVALRLIVQDPLSKPTVQPPLFCIDTVSREITIPEAYELPIVTPLADTVCVGNPITLQVENYPNAKSYRWVFTREEDGASFDTTAARPLLELGLPPGTFRILLQVQVRASDTCRLELPLGPIFSKGASGNIVGPYSLCLGEQATFRVDNIFQTAPLVRWRWLLDGKTLAEGSNDSIPTVTYTFSALKADQVLPYILNLELEADGCLQTLQWLVWVTRPLVRPLQNDFVTDCQGGFQRIALDASTVNLLPPWQAQWSLQTAQGEQPLQPERAEGGVFDLRLPVGEHDVILRLQDSEGCRSDTVFRIQVPDLGRLVAAFTPDKTELSCPDLITFADSADGSPGNSLLKKGAGGDIPVLRRIWYFGDGTSVQTADEQSVSHLYKLPGIYAVRMSLLDADSCEVLSDSVLITIKGVGGSYVLGRRMGYQTLERVRMEALPVLLGVLPEQVGYNWASGDGRGGSNKVQFFDYGVPGAYVPSLVFSDSNSCVTSAFNQDTVRVLSCPELSLRDTLLCADRSSVRLSALPAGFVPMQYENSLFRFSSQVLFAWEVDGTPVDAAQGGADSVQSFTAGGSGPFAVDPADADGRLYRVRMWVLSDYVDKQDSAASVLGEVRCEQEHSFRVRFSPLPSFVLADSVPDDCRPGERLLQARHQAFADSATYRWVLGDGQVVQTRRPELRHTYAASGTYTVQLLAYSDEGCSYADSLQVVVPVLSVARIQAPDGCAGTPLQMENRSELQGSVSYSWDFDYRGGAPRLQPRNERPLVTYERPGRYVVYMQVTVDSTGCSYTAMDTLEVFPVPQLRMPARFPICPGETVALSPLQVSDSLQYRWSTGDTTAAISVSPDRRTVYTLTATNVHGCQTIDSVVVEPLTVKLDSTRFQGCEGSILSLRAPSPTQQYVRAFYRWPNGDTTSTWQVAAAGDYTLQLTLVDTTGKQCEQELVLQASFNPLPADVLPDRQYFCFKWGGALELQAAEGPYAYRWLDTQETGRRVTRSAQGLYKVELTDLQTGCQSVDSIQVVELCEGVVVAPNTFTPNSDGFNDYFVPKAEGVRQLRLLIYSRWGELVFDRSYADEQEMGRPGMGWDGTLQGRPQQEGLYSYVLFYGTPLSGKQPALYGQVLLVR